MNLGSLLELLTLLVLTATLPVAFLAVRGFRNAPFGRVLRPLPVVFLGYIAYIFPQVLDVAFPMSFYATVSSIAVLATLVAATEATLLLTGRRAV